MKTIKKLGKCGYLGDPILNEKGDQVTACGAGGVFQCNYLDDKVTTSRCKKYFSCKGSPGDDPLSICEHHTEIPEIIDIGLPDENVKKEKEKKYLTIGDFNPIDAFDAVYIINRLLRPDRWKRCVATFEGNDWIFKKPIRVEAIDGNSIEIPKTWNASVGAYGCLKSHIKVCDLAIESGYKKILVFEDDFILTRQFQSKFYDFFSNVPDDWQALWLGGKDKRKWDVNDHVDRLLHAVLAHAYALRGDMINFFRDYLGKDSISRDWDTHFCNVMPKYKIYSPKEWIVFQGGFKSDNVIQVTETKTENKNIKMINPGGKLKVGFILPNLLHGGVERWLISLLKEFKKSDKVEVSCVGHPEMEKSTWDSVIAKEVSDLTELYSLSLIPGATCFEDESELARSVSRNSDIVVVWSVNRNVLKELKNNLVVGVSHGIGDWWMKESVDYVDEWVAVSEAASDPIPAKSTVIRNGIDLERCRSFFSKYEARYILGLPQDKKIACHLGRISEEKRIQNIINSLEFLPEEWVLLLVGNGKCELQLNDRVIKKPAIQDISLVWSAADVAVVASRGEGYCLSAIESIACGVPLVSTKVGIINDFASEIEIIPENASPKSIAYAIKNNRKISDKLREFVENQSSEKMMRGWEEFFVEKFKKFKNFNGTFNGS